MASTIFTGNKVKALKQNLSLNGAVDILSGTVDPTATATSANAGSLYLNTSTGKVYRKKVTGNDTNWELLGAGSGAANNLMKDVNPDFEANSVTPWVKGTVTLDATTKFPNGTPTFGSGASGTLAITAQSSGALDGAYSLQYADSAATTAGDFVASDAFSVSPAYRAQPLAIAFKYSVTAGAANGVFAGNTTNSFGIAIYDVTNSQFIQPAGCFQIVQSSGVGTVLATFQTSASGASYRLVVYNANATSGAITLLMDNFYVGPQNVAYGVPASDWQAWTPTGSWNTNTTYSGMRRVVGDTEYYQIKIALSGAPNSATLSLNLPSGRTIDTAKLVYPTTDRQVFGLASILDNGSADYFGTVVYNNATSVLVQPKTVDLLGGPLRNTGAVDQTNPMTWANGDTLMIEFSVPILGLSSNTVMSSDTDTREVSFRGTNTASTAIGALSQVPFTASRDTHSGWDGIQKYDIKITGSYKVYARLESGSGNAGTIYIYKSGAIASTSAAMFVSGLTIYEIYDEIECNAGDYIEIKADASGTNTLASTANRNVLTITRKSGPATIAASEDVYAQMYTSGDHTHTANTVVSLTEVLDSHGVLNAGVLTAPSPGMYEINFIAQNRDGAQSAHYVAKNGSQYRYIAGNTTLNDFVTGSVKLRLLAGETVDVRNNSTQTFAACEITFQKVGD